MKVEEALKVLDDIKCRVDLNFVPALDSISDLIKRMANELYMESGVPEPYPEQTMNPHKERPADEDQSREWA